MSYPQRSTQLTFKPIDSIYEDRLRQFTDVNGHYKNLMLPKFFSKDILRYKEKPTDGHGSYLELKHWAAPALTKPFFKDVVPSKLDEFNKFQPGNGIGPAWSSHWFQVKFKVPSSFLKEEELWLAWDAGCEGMVFDKTGLPIQGLTGDGERTIFILPPEWYSSDKEYTFYIEMGCNGMFGSTRPTYNLKICEIQVPNLEAHALFYDFWILSDGSRESEAPQKYKASEICNRIMDTFDPDDVTSISRCRKIAQEFLGPNVDSENVYKESKLPPVNTVYAIGNCHIDTAWLWDFATSKTKIARSWSSQLRLIEKYPEYVFVASAAIHFKWLLDYYPDLFEKVKQAIKGGRFIPLGGAWVENDTNVPSGEGLARQFILGQRYFEHLFGFRSDIYWLPDSFGYSSQIPQLCRLAGMPNFLTQKLSWNNVDVFPNSSFNWVGLDYSQVLVHMPPDNTYTADANFGDVKRSVHNHKNLYNDQKGMLLYGKGDGGGGPTPDMVEKLRRIRGYADYAGGAMPTVDVGATVKEFFEKLRDDTHDGKDLPSWRGELYLEYHRGTYTTQAKVKNMMRISETLIRDVEVLASAASIAIEDYKYPHTKIEKIWADIGLCQFHDVLPGSCIQEVYHNDVWPLLTEVIEREQDLIKEVLQVIGLKEKGEGPLVKVNTLPWRRSSIVAVDSVPSGFKAFSQNEKYVAFDNTNGSLMVPVSSKPKFPSTITKKDGLYILDNGKLKASIDDNGLVRSLVDLSTGREIIDTTHLKGGNQFVMFSDTPLNFQAWDTELYSLGKFKLVESAVSVKVLESGPLISSLEVVHKLSETSRLTTVISLEAFDDSEDATPSSLKFDSTVDWDETYKFLKVQFPVTISEEFASYETQFGITKRPTHYNTTWDTAKFECCCHKFIDFSDFNYGVSLLNNNKYGGNVHTNVMTLSLLRAPKYPDPTADIGKHTFSYALLPHTGSLSYKTVRAGWEFNDRLNKAFHLSGAPAVTDVVSIAGDKNLILSNVKRGEDDFDTDSRGSLTENLPKKYVGLQTLVLRIYEALGGVSKATISVKGSIKKVFKTNLLEEEIEEIEFDSSNNSFKIFSRAFEVSTYRVVLRGN
ncbi:DEKNAAC102954 [Brettanomyces naardenensis]|uniref:Alpha-mannosidase n=1 Tax=Brettanomyces naardenensis TaxID=13370 RepID=A0A448YM78_BRENA|nr:DEKNAAC102954 [Brettanomyces naardenensis]